jgi:hypothetical protein
MGSFAPRRRARSPSSSVSGTAERSRAQAARSKRVWLVDPIGASGAKADQIGRR